MKRYIYYIIGAIALMLTGCKEDVVSSLFADDGEIKAGEPVMFTTRMPGTTTRGIEKHPTAFNAYTPVAHDYTFTVKMYQEPETPATEPTLLGAGTYKPDVTVTGEDEEVVTTYPADGTLTATATPLYWPGNAKKYGFEAEANAGTLATDQTDAVKLLAQDHLKGYGFEPLYNTDTGDYTDTETALNYRTSKKWYADNKIALGLGSANSECKKIPLYLQHQRAKITIILKAGEGVERPTLAFATAATNITTLINSYQTVGGNKEKTEIQPFAEEESVNYGTTEVPDNASSTKYTAIVEPHNYLEGATNDVIADIQLSGQHFTFYASNDAQYNDYVAGEESATAHMNAYNLTAGKHLIIEATLGRESRKIVITAYVVDWTEVPVSSIVDDYGQTGDPEQIETRQQLFDFLSNPAKNKAGNVAIIVPSALNLDDGTAWNYNEDGDDANDLPLNCTLNLAGATLRTTHRVFSVISSSGNLVNGVITVGDGATVDAAVAKINEGSIERVDVAAKKVDGTASTGKASRAGLVVTNHGSILNCDSELPVQGVDNMVGGIAAESVYASGTGATMPIIEGCKVNARVDGTTGTTGGGIVGTAEGRVTNNTFEYGITIMQDDNNFKNIIHTKGTHDLRAYGNAWPTIAANHFGTSESDDYNENITPEADRYTGVIDSQKELAYVLTSSNTSTTKIRLSDDFSVTKTESSVGAGDGWNYGDNHTIENSTGSGNVFFKLDGNHKTITTDALLFSFIENDVYNLTIRLSADLIATPNNGNDVMAPLAYAVYAPTGETVRVSNIQVKSGTHRIQATTAAGMVVWVYGPGNAVIEDCQVKAKVQVWVSAIGSDAKIYSGGIVANAARATITRCVYHNTTGTLFRNTAGTYNATPDDGNDTNNQIYFGGILGGTSPKGEGNSAEKPSVLITDCSSWFDTKDNVQKGAIVGYARYGETGSLANGIKDGCQGNWWNTNSDAIGTGITGKTDEQIIGRRNAVAPTQDSTFDPTN